MNTSANVSSRDCCDARAKTAAKVSALCPGCGTKGKAVEPITIESLVAPEARVRLRGSEGFRFCAEPGCSIAYFHPESGERIDKAKVRVRIGQKETAAPRPVCYCFDRTVEEIEADVAATGMSPIADDITAKCRQGLDRCAETNPQGSCCLGNVRRALKDARARHGRDRSGAKAADGAAACCPVDAPDEVPAAAAGSGAKTRNAGRWASVGAIGAAVLSSACCWLPLLLIGFGASAAGIAGFFESYRPYFLGATALLLAGGFYLVYFRKPKCEPGSACATPDPRLTRLNRGMLWLATVLVLAFAAFSNYVGLLLGGGDGARAEAAATQTSGSVLYDVEGMHCEACTVTLRNGLLQVPGVTEAKVDYEQKTARLYFDPAGTPPSDAAIREAIEEAGYTSTRASAESGAARTVTIAIERMTCAGCAAGLSSSLSEVPGVTHASVDYDAKRATVRLTDEGSVDGVLKAISVAGFKGSVNE